MVAYFVFEECAMFDHARCPGERNMPKDPVAYGGELCACECHIVMERELDPEEEKAQ